MTRLWFNALVAVANSCAWLSSRYDYAWEPAISVSHAVCDPIAPSATTVRKALRAAVAMHVIGRHGNDWKPWPKVDDLSRIGTWSTSIVEEYSQVAEYIATHMNQRYAPSVDAWWKRVAAARAVLLQRAGRVPP